MKTIKIVIDPSGKVKYDFNGFKGQGCVELFDQVMAQLRLQVELSVTSQQMKPEAYVADTPMLSEKVHG